MDVHLALWEVVSSIILHTILWKTSYPIHTDGKGTSMDIASSSSSSNVRISIVCMETWITFDTLVRITAKGSKDNHVPRDGLFQVDDLCWSCELLDDLLKGLSCHALIQDFLPSSNRSLKAMFGVLGLCIIELFQCNL
jgi:hypothetical protein